MHTAYPYSDQELIGSMMRATRAYIRASNKAFRCDIPEDLEVAFVDNSKVRRGSGEKKLKALSEASCLGDNSTDLKLKYNLGALRAHPDVYLNYVIPHEVAHLVVFRKFNQMGAPAEVHGAEWHAVMKRFGRDPDRSLNIDKATWELYAKSLKQAKEDDDDGEQDNP